MEDNKIKEIKSKDFTIVTISIVIVAIIVIILALAIIQNKQGADEREQNVSYIYTADDGTKVNNSEQLRTIKTLDGLAIQITSLTEHNNYTKILGTVLNTTGETLGGYEIQSILMDKDGNEKVRIDGYISEIEPGEKAELNSSIIGSYANVFDILIIKK